MLISLRATTVILTVFLYTLSLQAMYYGGEDSQLVQELEETANQELLNLYDPPNPEQDLNALKNIIFYNENPKAIPREKFKTEILKLYEILSEVTKKQLEKQQPQEVVAQLKSIMRGKKFMRPVQQEEKK